LSSMMKFVMLIWFSASVVTALRTFASVSRCPRAFQVPALSSVVLQGHA
jgi:hypothetical protein